MHRLYVITTLTFLRTMRLEMKMKLQILILVVLFGFISSDNDDCKDTSDKCAGWASQGFCTNCFYTCEVRIKYCQKTCEYCTGQKTCENCTVTTTTLPPSTTTIKCADYGDFCKDWAKNGFCDNNLYPCSYRMKYCAKTCGLCAPGACPN
ncbi:hypothetical protein L3Y34_018897 [Caenorhabditis briggsae]|uniref:ShKT domain-containing protein n=2 Tax=Caenorhabditis briggsae TaxID=6238 RepID=A0AAE9DMQ0_CAEBR|nr:hypothetical protein L3Y34_018897 [Caenorhabditis briggsae]